jgi:hypothetical protein
MEIVRKWKITKNERALYDNFVGEVGQVDFLIHDAAYR